MKIEDFPEKKKIIEIPFSIHYTHKKKTLNRISKEKISKIAFTLVEVNGITVYNNDQVQP